MGAYAAFERAIKMSRPTESIYYYLATELGTTSVSLGRQDLTLYWAEHALSTRLESDVHGSLLNLAGLGARSLGNLDSAERYCAQGLDIARTAGNMKLVSHGMSNLALVYEECGEYDRALTLAREAVGLNADEDTLCRSILVVILSATGRYKEAIDVLQSTIATLKPASTAIYRDRRGSLMHHLAGITALTGDFENAWRVYEDTGERPGVLQGISNSTQGAWLAAGLGRADARERMIKSYAEIEAAHVHPAAVRNHIKSLVRAAVLLGDADMASRCADQMLNHPQSPTSKSVSWFYVGEAARISGDVAGSRRGYEQSIASGLRNVAVEKARARLSELSR